MSVAPDEGLQLLQQRMAADAAVRYGQAPRDDGGQGPGPYEHPAGDVPGAQGGADGPGGLTFALSVMLQASRSLERLAGRLGNPHAPVPWEIAHPIEVPGRQIATAGIIQDPDILGPQDGWAWRVFGVFLQMGAGATSWAVYYDNVNDPTNQIFGQTVSGRWEPSHFYLMPNRQLVYQSIGGGLTVGKACAVEIAVPYLPAYMSK